MARLTNDDRTTPRAPDYRLLRAALVAAQAATPTARAAAPTTTVASFAAASTGERPAAPRDNGPAGYAPRRP